MPALATIEIDVDGREITAEVEARLADRRELMDELGELLLNEADDSFERERAPDGTEWAPLSPATLEAAARRGITNKRTLQDMGTRGGLRGTLAKDVREDEVAATSNKVYAMAHMHGLGERSFLGTRRRFAAIPARPYAGLSPAGREAAEATIADWVSARLGGE